MNCSTCICCWLKHRFTDASVQSNRRNFCVWFFLFFFFRPAFFFSISLPLCQRDAFEHLSQARELFTILLIWFLFIFYLHSTIYSENVNKKVLYNMPLFFCVQCFFFFERCIVYGWSFCCSIRQNFTWDAFKKKKNMNLPCIHSHSQSFAFFFTNALWLFWSSCNWLWNLTLSSSWVWVMRNKTNIRSRITLIVNDHALKKHESNGITSERKSKTKMTQNQSKFKSNGRTTKKTHSNESNQQANALQCKKK